MKVVYIAGPYGDKGGYLAIDRNIARAREAAAWLADNGIGFFCPHLNSAHLEIVANQPNLWWCELDLRFLEVCDAILMLEGWDYSEGAKIELAAALDQGLPVFYSFGNLSKWAKEC